MAQTDAATRRSLPAFVALTFALSAPFWVLGGLVPVQMMPGLPITALMFVCPGLAAAILVGLDGGYGAIRALIARAFDARRVPSRRWWMIVIGVAPFIAVVSWASLFVGGSPVPTPRFNLTGVATLCLVFLISGLAEEIGWTGFATERLLRRFGSSAAGLLLGLICASFHDVALVQAHRSWIWIGWWSLGTVSSRVIMTQIFARAGRSVFAAAVFHMTVNLGWQLFPVSGSYWDPKTNGLITTATAAILLAAWSISDRRSRLALR